MGQDCAVCRIVRFYLLMALPLLVMLGAGAMGSGDARSTPIWFANVQLINVLAGLSLTSLVVVLLYKLYSEFWLPKKRMKALDRLREKSQM